MVAHSSLTGADLHEPKGIETSSEGQVYVSNGAGSGSWKDPLSRIPGLTQFALNDTLSDVSTASSVFFALPQKSTLIEIVGVLGGGITTANSVLTVYKNGTAQTPTITVPFSGSAARTKVSETFNVAFEEGNILEVRTDGGSTGTASLSLTAKFRATV